MRILHLSTSTSGGAGVAARRLVEEQNKVEGIDAILLTMQQARSRRYSVLHHRDILARVNTYIQRGLSKSEFELLTPFSISRVEIAKIHSIKPDIVHIHNWYNLLSLNDIQRISKEFTTIISVHDERILTGGCHITYGCLQYQSGCHSCPQVRAGKSIIRFSKSNSDIVFQHNTVNIISPSKWLADKFQTQGSPFLNSHIRVIPNIVSPKNFVGKEHYRDGIIRVLFIAANASSPNKRLSLATESVIETARKNASKKFRFTVVGISKFELVDKPNNLEILKYLKLTEEQVFQIMKDNDILLVTSRSENSPNVIVEAQLVGLFVIATNVGGVSELVQDMETGFLCGPDGNDLSMMLKKYIQTSDQKINKIVTKSKIYASARHDTSHLVRETLEFYRYCSGAKV